MGKLLVCAVCALISSNVGCSKRPRGKSVEVVEIKLDGSRNSTSDELVKFVDSDWPQWRGSLEATIGRVVQRVTDRLQWKNFGSQRSGRDFRI